MSETYSLAILEYLIQNNGCSRIDELWSSMAAQFQNCTDFFSAVGPTPDSLELFIKQQPALFHISGGYVYTLDAFYQIRGEDGLSGGFGSCGGKKLSSDQKLVVGDVIPYGYEKSSCNTLELEMEAVRYFQEQLLRKPERWIPIKSLAGHLSQASASIRMIVGPQSDFARFLLRHPLFFQIQGELVGLSESLRTHWNNGQATYGKRKQRPLSFHGPDDPRKQGPYERHHLPLHLQVSQTTPEIDIKHRTSYLEKDTIALSVDDCKAVLWLKSVVASSHSQPMPFAALLGEISCAPKSIHHSIGWTQIELLEFLKKYDKIFKLDETSQTITEHPTNSLHLMIVNKSVNTEDSNVLLAQRGCIFCVNRLWGIIDLGFHEHVFFDRSLFKHVTDLSKHFQVKETVFFNAVLASRESRAKWRATCVWKETDRLVNYLQGLTFSKANSFSADEYGDDPDSGLDNSDEAAGNNNTKSLPSALRYLFDDIAEPFEQCAPQFASIRLADAWELHPQALTNNPAHIVTASPSSPQPVNPNDPLEALDKSDLKDVEPLEAIRSGSVSPVSELNTLSGVPSISCIGDASSSIRSNSPARSGDAAGRPVGCARCMCGSEMWGAQKRSDAKRTIATQTLFTGEIMATKLYHDEAVS